ncbi:hypothetical protein AMATHDRAFT_77273 [Amanita thiersii Skay4041]|uniref:PEBP-like protein n=1 Tax=Amanita thiersii Skay4041 TaxID=703135 RepID=A0A2A9NG96_9AGAR|nr:hypothetical protein AMATHDRAFT_77273 [Amanita thiersii Skay4041]
MDPLSSIVTALQRSQIIPDVIPAIHPPTGTFQPSVLFSIIWPNGREAVLSASPVELTQEDTVDEPDINFTPMILSDISAASQSADTEPTYTLVMTDPDAPSREEPLFREFRHWVITGIKSAPDSSSKVANLNAIKTKPSTTPYRPPGPRPGSGIHRYTFLLFEEPAGGITIPQGEPEYGSALEERRSWDAMAFARKYNLKLVGANFFLLRSTS